MAAAERAPDGLRHAALGVEITSGGAEDLPVFVDLLEEAARWLWDRGVHQWQPDSMGPQDPVLRAQIASGALLTAREAGALVGGCLLATEPGSVWDGHAGDAAYLHKLVVARAAAGRGLGERILEAAEAWTRLRSLQRLRLDCWDGNQRLRAWYRSLGYQELEAAEEHGYSVRLFEKQIVGQDDRAVPEPLGREAARELGCGEARRLDEDREKR